VQLTIVFPSTNELAFVDDTGVARQLSAGIATVRKQDSMGIWLTVPEFSHSFGDSGSITTAVDRSPDL
jgi:hypothetical protein